MQYHNGGFRQALRDLFPEVEFSDDVHSTRSMYHHLPIPLLLSPLPPSDPIRTGLYFKKLLNRFACARDFVPSIRETWYSINVDDVISFEVFTNLPLRSLLPSNLSITPSKHNANVLSERLLACGPL